MTTTSPRARSFRWRLRGTSPYTGRELPIASRKSHAEILERAAFYTSLGYTGLTITSPDQHGPTGLVLGTDQPYEEAAR